MKFTIVRSHSNDSNNKQPPVGLLWAKAETMRRMLFAVERNPVKYFYAFHYQMLEIVIL